jgi:integrase
VLPLETDTGNAIAEYILDARPESDSEYVFLRSFAPYKKLSDVGSMGNILEKYRKRATIIRNPFDGKSFHALRRSMGTWMLESGVPLTLISQVLGHKEQDSTKQYLSMDHERLAACALDFQGIPVGGGLFL